MKCRVSPDAYPDIGRNPPFDEMPRTEHEKFVIWPKSSGHDHSIYALNRKTTLSRPRWNTKLRFRQQFRTSTVIVTESAGGRLGISNDAKAGHRYDLES